MFNIPPVRARVAVMYIMAQSCLHIVINFIWPSEHNKNTPYLSPYHRPLAKSATFCTNIEGQLPRLSSKFCLPRKTVVTTNGQHDKPKHPSSLIK